MQMLILGLAVAALFFATSRSQPLTKLSKERPPTRIFCAEVLVSIAGQTVVHIAALLTMGAMCAHYVHGEGGDAGFSTPDGPFSPNTVNSAVFLLSSLMQVSQSLPTAILGYHQ